MEIIETSVNKQASYTKKADWQDLITNPTSYFLFTLIRAQEVQSLSTLQRSVPAEFHALLGKIIDRLEDSGDIDVDGDKIILKRRDFLKIESLEKLLTFLPDLNQKATEISITKAISRKPGNFTKYIAIPTNPAKLKQLNEAVKQFAATIDSISRLELGESNSSEPIKFVTLTTADISLEDLV